MSIHRFTRLAAHALAQDNGAVMTPAGTTIRNIATATFDNPAGGQLSVTSNEVVTTVQSKPDFDIVYLSGNDGLGSASPVGNTPDAAPAVAQGTVAAGESFNTSYIAVNNGNTTQNITLTTDNGGKLAPQGVAYYIDSNKDGTLDATEKAAGPVSSLSVPNDDPATTTVDEGLVYFIQVMTLPTGAKPGQQYAATPVGAGQGYDAATQQPVPMTETATVLGLQYALVTVANQPPVPADVTNPTLTNTAGPTPISPLVATDDGTVASFTIQTLPDPASGVLYYNGSPVTAGQTITDPTLLTFDPADGFVGNATFDYTATDNLNLGSTTNKNPDGTVTSGPATYTIPVQAQPSTDLKVEKTNTAPGTNGWTDLPSDTVRLGASTFYWIRVTNNGPAPVTGAVLTD